MQEPLLVWRACGAVHTLGQEKASATCKQIRQALLTQQHQALGICLGSGARDWPGIRRPGSALDQALGIGLGYREFEKEQA